MRVLKTLCAVGEDEEGRQDNGKGKGEEKGKGKGRGKGNTSQANTRGTKGGRAADRAQRRPHLAPSPSSPSRVFPDSAFDLLARCLDVDPTRRISAKDALLHPFLR